MHKGLQAVESFLNMQAMDVNHIVTIQLSYDPKKKKGFAGAMERSMSYKRICGSMASDPICLQVRLACISRAARE